MSNLLTKYRKFIPAPDHVWSGEEQFRASSVEAMLKAQESELLQRESSWIKAFGTFCEALNKNSRPNILLPVPILLSPPPTDLESDGVPN